MIKNILFDSGGVIIYDRIADLIVETFGVSKEAYQKARDLAWNAYKRGYITGATYWAHMFNRLDIAVDVGRGFELYAESLFLVPGTLDVIRRLHGKYRLVLVNNEAKELDMIRDEKFQFVQYFSERFSSWQIGKAKPDREYYQHVIEKLGDPVSTMLYIDYQKKNVDAAQSLGIDSICFTDCNALIHEMACRGVVVE